MCSRCFALKIAVEKLGENRIGGVKDEGGSERNQISVEIKSICSSRARTFRKRQMILLATGLTVILDSRIAEQTANRKPQTANVYERAKKQSNKD